MGIDEIATIFRGLERVTIVSAAILAMYFGYKLFLAGVDGNQTGEFSGKTFKLKLIKVGPGIFFALFGTSVLISTTWQNIQFDGSGPPANQGSGARLTSFFGAGDSDQLRRELETVSLIKNRFQSGEISEEAFLSSVSSLQKMAAKIYVGNDIYEKCEFLEEFSETGDCQIYFRLIE